MKAMNLLLMLAAVALPLGPVNGDDQDATETATNDTPRLHTVEREDLTLRATVTGRLEAGVAHRLRLLPDAYTGPFHVEEVHHRGGQVNAGDLVLTIDTTRIDENIESAQRQLDDQTRRLDHARKELTVLEERHATQLKQHETALSRAQTELDVWNSYNGPKMLKNAELSVRGMENFVSNQREELQQLEQMYEGTELDTETKEIVLERARRSLEIAEERLALTINDHHVTVNVTHPQRTEDVNNDVRNRAESLAHLIVNHSVALERKHAEIDSLEHSIYETQLRLSRLRNDREQFMVRASASGLMTRIDLEPKDSVNARQTMATIHDPSQKTLRVELTAANLRVVREGDVIELRPPEYPELSLAGTVKDISPIGRARGDETIFDAEIHIDGSDPLLRVGLRITGAAERTLENVLTLPRKALKERDGRHYVTVDVDGEQDDRDITIGPGSDKLVQVVNGLSAGDQVVMPAKE